MKPFIAVVGAGTWGRNIVRNFYNLNALNTVCDIDDDNLNAVYNDYLGIKLTKSFDDVISNPEIKAVCIVTPSHTHFKLVKAALEAGKHVYVEKPISTIAKEAQDLKNLAEAKNLKLMVGHLLLYHPAVNRLRMLIADGVLGKIRYVQSDRLNVNFFKNDRSVMWDLAPHDVSMAAYVLSKDPVRVIQAAGCSSDGNDIMDITHITIEFEDGIIAQISDSWIHPQKRVVLMVRGDSGTAYLDDTLPDGKLKIYDNFSPQNKDIEVPDYLEIEPLKLECQHFLNCVETGKTPRSDAENGFLITKILEEAEKMMLGDRTKTLDGYNFSSFRKKKTTL